MMSGEDDTKIYHLKSATTKRKEKKRDLFLSLFLAMVDDKKEKEKNICCYCLATIKWIPTPNQPHSFHIFFFGIVFYLFVEEEPEPPVPLSFLSLSLSVGCLPSAA